MEIVFYDVNMQYFHFVEVSGYYVIEEIRKRCRIKWKKYDSVGVGMRNKFCKCLRVNVISKEQRFKHKSKFDILLIVRGITITFISFFIIKYAKMTFSLPIF